MKGSANNIRRNYTLPRSRILRGRENIQRLFRKGRVLREKHIDLRYLILPGQPGICLMGFIVGKRLGKAHERNATKRRMRESYRHNQHLVSELTESGTSGIHGIFIAKKAGIPYQEMEQQCRSLLMRVREAREKDGAS